MSRIMLMVLVFPVSMRGSKCQLDHGYSKRKSDISHSRKFFQSYLEEYNRASTAQPSVVDECKKMETANAKLSN